MTMLTDAYVEERNDELYLRSTRVRLSQVVGDWLTGQDPETIALNYPALTTAQVYGAIALYLSHRAELDRQFNARRQHEAALITEAQAQRSERLRAVHARMEALKARTASTA